MDMLREKLEEDKCTAIKGIEKNVGEIKKYVSEIVNASRDEMVTE